MWSEEKEMNESIMKQIKSLQQDVRYNTKLLEQIVDLIPPRQPNNEMKDMLKVQMGALRPLFEKANFEGKEQILGMLDNLFGGKV